MKMFVFFSLTDDQEENGNYENGQASMNLHHKNYAVYHVCVLSVLVMTIYGRYVQSEYYIQPAGRIGVLEHLFF